MRNRPALVRSVEAYTYPTMPTLHEVQVQYIDGWQYPDSDSLIWEREQGARVVGSLALPRIVERQPDMTDRLQAFLWAYQWGAVNRLAAHRAEDERELQLVSPWQSAVQVEDYQLYPVLKSLLMPRISLLLADDVGLGKTIEAGLILSELFARRRIRRVLIICPASLQLQWRDEMREKFHLDFTIVDRDETFRLQRELGVDSNPWASYPRIVTSMDYLRQRDVLESFEAATRTLSGHAEAILPWQMLIVDEVHNLAPSTYGDDSDRCEMLRHIAPSFEHRLFLSATPHNGYTISFSGLLELLDPVRFQQKASLDEDDHKQIGLAMVRRLKREFLQEGEPNRFAHRKVVALPISLHDNEKALFNALRAYREGLQRVLEGVGKRERHLGGFLMKLLTKRLLSSSYAFARTWWRHVEGLDIDEGDDDNVTQHAINRAEMVMNDDQERALREEDAMRQTGSWLRRRQYATQLTSQRAAINACLTRMGWGEGVMRQPLHDVEMPPDARWDELSRWIDIRLMRNGSLVHDERLILFTEYKHTLDYIMERLRRRGLASPQVESLYGGATSQQREHIKNAFNDPRNPLRILVGTDTVSEGISLQLTCRYVLHQEIPWNPMRLEQRNGRVDRHGQERDVFIFHFTSSDEADMQFMETVVKKVEQARTDLGSVGQVIDSTLEEHFTQRPLAVEELERRVDVAEQDKQETIDMRGMDTGNYAECVRAMQRLDATQLTLNLSPANTAALLHTAVLIEEGYLREEQEQGRPGPIYRFGKVPPTWKKLVHETLERQENGVSSKPKMVFDPAYFEVMHNGRRIYKPRTDAVLIRLGHPIMQRALSVLRRQLWEETATGMARWTIEQCKLPHQHAVLQLYLLIEATNQFREVSHQEIVMRPFEIRGNALIPMESELWQHIEQRPRESLPGPELQQAADYLRDLWPVYEERLRHHIDQERLQWRSDLEGRMKQRLQEEHRTEKASFDSRLRELKQQRNPAYLQHMQHEVERQRQHLLQGVLPLEELQQERFEQEQHLQDLEWQLEHSYLDTMKHMVERERERVLNQVLPQRYTLATVDVQPLAIRYLVNSDSLQ